MRLISYVMCFAPTRTGEWSRGRQVQHTLEEVFLSGTLAIPRCVLQSCVLTRGSVLQILAPKLEPCTASFAKACAELERSSLNYGKYEDSDDEEDEEEAVPVGSPRGRTTRSAPVPVFLPER